MTSPIGNPLRIQFNGSRCRVGVVLGRGYGWMILLFLVISECLFLVQFGMILVQVNVLGYFWDGCPRARPLHQKTIGKSGGWFSTIYWAYGSRSWTSCFDFAGVFFLTWTDLLLSCIDIWFALPWISCDILWCRPLPQGDLISNTIKVQEETTPQDINIKVFLFPRDEKQPFFPHPQSILRQEVRQSRGEEVLVYLVGTKAWFHGLLGFMGMLKAPRSSCCLK